MTVDPRTPVIVGVGQAAERIGAPDYRAMSAVQLAATAAQAALDDCAAPRVASAVEIAAGIRQFENSSPYSSAPLGNSTNYPRSVARAVGAEPPRAILDVIGGQGPQRLLTELAGTIAAGAAEVALVFGSDAPPPPATSRKQKRNRTFRRPSTGSSRTAGTAWTAW